MAIVEVNEQNFESELLSSELPVLIEFGAEWCGPCKVVAPELEALSRELEGKLKVATVDIDRSPLLSREFGVQSVPTFVVLDHGRPVTARQGALRLAELRALVEPVLPRAEGALKPAELAALLQQGQVAPIDTRDAGSFRRTRLPGAVNMALEEVETRLAELHMLPGAPVLYCRAGTESQALADRLREQGVPVAFLEGGLLGWEAERLPIERD